MSPPATLILWFKLRSPELAEDFERLMTEDRDIVRSSLPACADAASDLWVFCGRGPWTPPYSCRPPWQGAPSTLPAPLLPGVTVPPTTTTTTVIAPEPPPELPVATAPGPEVTPPPVTSVAPPAPAPADTAPPPVSTAP